MFKFSAVSQIWKKYIKKIKWLGCALNPSLMKFFDDTEIYGNVAIHV